jgi:DNA polymerase III epsilon subunit-like protein
MKPTYLVCFDFETTSAEPKTTRAVQLAAIGRVEGSDTHDVLMNEILNPEVTINYEAAAVHGITQEQASKGRIDKLACADLSDKLLHLRDEYEVVLAGHNSYGFDRPIFERLSGAKISQFLHIDTLVGATRLFPDAPNHKLSVADPEDQKKFGGPGLIQTLGLGSGEGAHDALADILMVDALVRHYASGLGKSFVELAQWCEQPRVLETVHFGKHRGKHWKDVPRWYIKFICEKFDTPTPDLIATVWHWHKMTFECMRTAQ